MLKTSPAVVWFALAGMLAGCSKPAAPTTVTGQIKPAGQARSSSGSVQAESQSATGPQSKWQPVRIDDKRLHNAFRLHEKVISGGLPEEPGMQALRELGVKTIISVDGARPDVDLAKKYGLRYVHLPHGYDGIPEERAKELAKAVRELEGPIYIHCHHGKHRSPAAAATACIAAGFIPAQHGLAFLSAAGTSQNYRGLYQAVAETHPLDRALLDEFKVEYQETVDVPPLAEAMVDLEQTHDHLKKISENGWQPMPEHPDLDPAHEALLLREHFTELLRTEETQNQPADFQQFLRQSEAAAEKLTKELESFGQGDAIAKIPAPLTNSFNLISRNCKTCHQQYRDVPSREKSATTK